MIPAGLILPGLILPGLISAEQCGERCRLRVRVAALVVAIAMPRHFGLLHSNGEK